MRRDRVVTKHTARHCAALDPSRVCRDHGYMVFDTLFGMDSSYAASPQMAEGAVAEDGGRGWRITLREGLRFHDGTPVLARDWGTIVQRRAKMDPVEGGGWSVYHTYWSGLDQFTPATHAFLRGNGRNAGPGWPSSPALEAMRAEWFAAPDLPAQQAVAARMQVQAFTDVPYIPLGQQLTHTAFRKGVTGVLHGLPVFWNIQL